MNIKPKILKVVIATATAFALTGISSSLTHILPVTSSITVCADTIYDNGPAFDDSTAKKVNYQATVQEDFGLLDKPWTTSGSKVIANFSNINGQNFVGKTVTVNEEIVVGSTSCVLVTTSTGQSFWTDKVSLSAPLVNGPVIVPYQLTTPLPANYKPASAYEGTINQWGNDVLAHYPVSPVSGRRVVYYNISTSSDTQKYKQDIVNAINAWNSKFVTENGEKGPFVEIDPSKMPNVNYYTITVGDTYVFNGQTLSMDGLAGMHVGGPTGEGTITLSKADFDAKTNSKTAADSAEYRKDVVMHELGHALGLDLDNAVFGPTDPRYNDMMAVGSGYSDDYAKDITQADLYYILLFLNY